MDGSANRVTSASLNGANADTLGGAGGAETHAITLAQSAAHTHDVAGVGTNTAGAIFAAGSDKGTTTVTSTSQGSGAAHNNMQPWIVKRFIIRF